LVLAHYKGAVVLGVDQSCRTMNQNCDDEQAGQRGA
jgi:hypothetical protein